MEKVAVRRDSQNGVTISGGAEENPKEGAGIVLSGRTRQLPAVPLTELHLSRFNCAELVTGSRRYGHRPRRSIFLRSLQSDRLRNPIPECAAECTINRLCPGKNFRAGSPALYIICATFYRVRPERFVALTPLSTIVIGEFSPTQS